MGFSSIKHWLLAFGSDLESILIYRFPSMAAIPQFRSPYVEFQAELEQIQKHKWLVSEKEGRDVGFERALMEWAEKHRQKWRQARNKPDGKK